MNDALNKFERIIERQFMRDSNWNRKGKIYPSQMGKNCARHLAYRYLGFDYESEMAPRVKVKFFLGDLSELAVLIVAKLSGLDIGLSQSQLDIEVNGFKSHGYIDGLLYRKGEPYVVECKSQSSYGFRKFKKEGFENRPEYMTQLMLYMRNLGVEKGIFVVVNTNTGHIAEKILNYDEKYVNRARNNVGKVLKSDNNNLPNRAFKITDFKWMSRKKCYEVNEFSCDYCDYIETCWPTIKTEIIGGKPKHRIYMEKAKQFPEEIKKQIPEDKLKI